MGRYTRRAEGYRYIRGVLGDIFGEEALGTLRRLRQEGPVETALSAELDFMIALFDGAANVARLELGAPSPGDSDAFVRWMASRDDDRDLTADLRMMVPAYYDLGRQRTKVWMFLGWMEDSIEVRFARRPDVRSPFGRDVEVAFGESSYPIARPVVVDALVSRLLDRDAFRALCDRHETTEAIVRAVE